MTYTHFDSLILVRCGILKMPVRGLACCLVHVPHSCLTQAPRKPPATVISPGMPPVTGDHHCGGCGGRSSDFGAKLALSLVRHFLAAWAPACVHSFLLLLDLAGSEVTVRLHLLASQACGVICGQSRVLVRHACGPCCVPAGTGGRRISESFWNSGGCDLSEL